MTGSRYDRESIRQRPPYHGGRWVTGPTTVASDYRYSWNGMRKVKLMSEASSVMPMPRLVTTEVESDMA